MLGLMVSATRSPDQLDRHDHYHCVIVEEAELGDC